MKSTNNIELYKEFYNKVANSLTISDELLKIPRLILEERYNYGIIRGKYEISNNSIIIIIGRIASQEEIKKLIIHELLHATYTNIDDELEIRRLTNDYWWAYKTGKFAQ